MSTPASNYECAQEIVEAIHDLKASVESLNAAVRAILLLQQADKTSQDRLADAQSALTAQRSLR